MSLVVVPAAAARAPGGLLSRKARRCASGGSRAGGCGSAPSLSAATWPLGGQTRWPHCGRGWSTRDEGDLPPRADPDVLARYLSAVGQGISAQATGGAAMTCCARPPPRSARWTPPPR
ncbi:hypothetical protein AB0C18_40100 [Nonomuraea muscovyensis]|uniref:hypothetical protein n=1 Tax=Nonomuraea muscovyensis TaxID=1124761 RepID=UPI003401A178